jgi:prepilin-type N-terminal cleavage/methylation domain-containing protein
MEARAPTAAGPRASGFTLLELLLVLVVLGLVLGLGMGMFAALDLEQRQALALVRNALRSAASDARARGAPSRAVLDRAERRVTVEAPEIVGTWRFEEGEGSAAGGAELVLGGGELVDDGFIGAAISFARAAERGAGAAAEIQTAAGGPIEPRDGFAIRCAVALDLPRGAPLLHLGGVAGLHVEEDLSLRGWIVPEMLDSSGRVLRGGHVSVRTRPGLLQPGTWRAVELDYDRRVLRLAVDGRVEAEVPEDRALWPAAGGMMLSHPLQAFGGRIDDLVVAVMTRRSSEELPQSVEFAPGSPPRVCFDAGGGLDRSFHAGPLSIELAYADGTRRAVHVGLFGTVE